jgi:hypothetical protein
MIGLCFSPISGAGPAAGGSERYRWVLILFRGKAGGGFNDEIVATVAAADW